MGRYHDAVVSNLRAYEADAALARACLAPYAIEHNADMLIYAANMAGQVRCRAASKPIACKLCTTAAGCCVGFSCATSAAPCFPCWQGCCHGAPGPHRSHKPPSSS